MTSKTRLIVLAAFDRNGEGKLVPAFEARQIESEEIAKHEAHLLAGTHAGVMAWSREADLAVGEYGPPTVLYQHGELPVLE